MRHMRTLYPSDPMSGLHHGHAALERLFSGLCHNGLQALQRILAGEKIRVSDNQSVQSSQLQVTVENHIYKLYNSTIIQYIESMSETTTSGMDCTGAYRTPSLAEGSDDPMDVGGSLLELTHVMQHEEGRDSCAML